MTCAADICVAKVSLYSEEEEEDSITEEEEFLKNRVSKKEEVRGLKEDLVEDEVTCDLQLLMLIRIFLNLS